MSTGRVGVAISTTGDEHRLGFLETCVQSWWRALARRGLPTTLYVTVDGDEAACERVLPVIAGFAHGLRVGQPYPDMDGLPKNFRSARDGRLGVATNKNTGIEALMTSADGLDGIEHLFLSDDDTWPRLPHAVGKHVDLSDRLPHSMVCWGKSRLVRIPRPGSFYAEWNWPRGSVLYAHRSVVEQLGGMDERFGPGGHEHVEWSRRIHQAGLTPVLYPSPASYATRGGWGARVLWNAEDMAKPGESSHATGKRRASITSVRRQPADWEHINKIMDLRDGDTSFVPFTARENGRSSATLFTA